MQLHKFDFRAMGSPCSVRVQTHSEAQAQTWAQLAIAEVERLEQRYSRYRQDSLLRDINRAAGAEAVSVDAETAALLAYAFEAWRESDGLFDITSGVLRRCWDFRSQRLPSAAEVAAVLPLVGMDKLIWRAPELSLPLAGMQLDFGGCVKEYAADAAATCLRGAGAQHGLVELGGDVAVIGPKASGEPWPLAIRHPRQPAPAVVARLGIAQGALATSGDYERALVVGGQRYCHILNPLTGWPVASPASVSVIAPSCLLAGTASTVAMLKGETDAPAWLDALGLPYCLVRQDSSVINHF